MPTISIIVPIYNVEQYLHKCIDSILSQTFKDFELILVDDGSPDNCGEICDEYAAKDKRVKVIHKANGGLSDARNAGLNIVKGDYIGFVDSDDWIESNMYEVLLKLCINNKADVSTCLVNFQNNRNEIEVNKSNVSIFDSKTAIYLLYEGKLNGFSTWNKLYKKEIFNDLKFPKGRIYEDAAIMYRVFDVANYIAYINYPLYNYNYREGSITKSNFSEKRFDVVHNYYETYSFMNIQKCVKSLIVGFMAL
jgi:glycosyltransferase involved in cell wall biosynthesis